MARPAKKAVQTRQPRKSKSNGADELLRFEIVRLFPYNDTIVWNRAFDFIKGIQAPILALPEKESSAIPEQNGIPHAVEAKLEEQAFSAEHHPHKSKFDSASLNL